MSRRINKDAGRKQGLDVASNSPRHGMGRSSHTGPGTVKVTMNVPVNTRLSEMDSDELKNLWSWIGSSCDVDLSVAQSRSGYGIVIQGTEAAVTKAKALITSKTQHQVRRHSPVRA